MQQAKKSNPFVSILTIILFFGGAATVAHGLALVSPASAWCFAGAFSMVVSLLTAAASAKK